MAQEIIVFIILGFTLSVTGYFLFRKINVKKANTGNGTCDNNACSGCTFKDQCH